MRNKQDYRMLFVMYVRSSAQMGKCILDKYPSNVNSENKATQHVEGV